MHQNAAGFSIPYKKLDAFIDWSNKQLESISLGENVWNVDFQLDANDTNLNDLIYSLDEINKLWGQGFPEALISVNNLRVKNMDITVMGKNSDTVKISNNGVAYMFFKRTKEEVKKLTQYNMPIFNIVGTANLNYFNGRVTPQIFVKDYDLKNITDF